MTNLIDLSLDEDDLTPSLTPTTLNMKTESSSSPQPPSTTLLNILSHATTTVKQHPAWQHLNAYSSHATPIVIMFNLIAARTTDTFNPFPDVTSFLTKVHHWLVETYVKFGAHHHVSSSVRKMCRAMDELLINAYPEEVKHAVARRPPYQSIKQPATVHTVSGRGRYKALALVSTPSELHVGAVMPLGGAGRGNRVWTPPANRLRKRPAESELIGSSPKRPVPITSPVDTSLYDYDETEETDSSMPPLIPPTLNIVPDIVVPVSAPIPAPAIILDVESELARLRAYPTVNDALTVELNLSAKLDQFTREFPKTQGKPVNELFTLYTEWLSDMAFYTRLASRVNGYSTLEDARKFEANSEFNRKFNHFKRVCCPLRGDENAELQFQHFKHWIPRKLAVGLRHGVRCCGEPPNTTQRRKLRAGSGSAPESPESPRSPVPAPAPVETNSVEMGSVQTAPVPITPVPEVKERDEDAELDALLRERTRLQASLDAVNDEVLGVLNGRHIKQYLAQQDEKMTGMQQQLLSLTELVQRQQTQLAGLLKARID